MNAKVKLPVMGIAITRSQVHESLFTFLIAKVREKIRRAFDHGLRDYAGDIIKHGDRVFDIDYRFWKRRASDKANYGTLIKDKNVLYGYYVKWDNGDKTQLIDPSRLIKWI